jgi:transposase
MNRRKAEFRSDEALTETRQTGVRMRCQGYTANADETALKVLKGGRKVGEKRHLSLLQELEFQRRIRQETPEAIGLPFALWTRRAVQALIEQETGGVMPSRTVGLYLRRWGFTPQKPLQKAYEQDPQAVTQWLENDYPAIAARKDPRGEKAGQETPAEPDLQPHESRYRAVHDLRRNLDRGGLDPVSEPLDAELPAQDLDRLRVHRSHAVTTWLATHRDRIEVFYLPAYSPELNPDELLNSELQGVLHSALPALTKAELKRKARTHLHRLQKQLHRVRRYFRHPTIADAAVSA